MSSLIVALGAAYWLGAFPTGWVLGRVACGVDVRELGSGRTGATNVARVLGWRAGLAVFAVDALKGFAGVAWTLRVAADAAGAHSIEAWGAGAGLAAIVGHVWSPLAGWRGGRGVATAAGVLAALEPLALAGAAAVFAAVLAARRIVSLASIAAALCLPLVVPAASWIAGKGVSRPVAALAFALALLVPLTHRDNLSRIRAGTEPALGRPRPEPPRLKTPGPEPKF